MSVKLDDFRITTDDGTVITGDTIREWNEAYDRGEFPTGYLGSEPLQGRPKIYSGKMDTLTVRLPHSQKEMLEKKAHEAGLSTSGYVRRVLALAEA